MLRKYTCYLYETRLLGGESLVDVEMSKMWKEYELQYVTAEMKSADPGSPTKAWICCRSLAGIASSNPAGGLDVCHL
jgi:hypothetical protein